MAYNKNTIGILSNVKKIAISILFRDTHFGVSAARVLNTAQSTINGDLMGFHGGLMGSNGD